MTDLLTGGGNRADGPTLDAATVVLLREGESGPECLMLRKTRGQTFGGLWVFPGGRTEDDDGTGLEGARRCAVREAREETGLNLEPAALVPLSHWAPPPEAPKRYYTWFFVAALPTGGHEVTVDGSEIGDHIWTTAAAAFAAHGRGEIKLLPPTWITLRWLTEQSDVASGVRAAAGRDPERFSTRIADDDGTLVALWMPDTAYPTADGDPPGPLDRPGPRHRLYMAADGWRYRRSP